MKKSTFKNHPVGSTFLKIIISNVTYADYCKSENAWSTEEHITKYPTCQYTDHRLIKITDNTLDADFSRFGWDSFTITLRQKPRGVSRSRRRITRQREPVLHRLRPTSLGFCFRVIEKTTSNFTSVILINLWQDRI